MPDFLEHLQQLIDEEAEQILERRRSDEKIMADLEKWKVDSTQDYELKKRHLSAERAHTLNIAWAAAELLRIEKAEPEYWFRTEKSYDGSSRMRRRITLRTRQAITAEGWPLMAWRDGLIYDGYAYTLILAAKPDDTGSRLAVIAQRRHDGYDDDAPYDAQPDGVRYLHRQPLAENEPPLPDYRNYESLSGNPIVNCHFENIDSDTDDVVGRLNLEAYGRSGIEQFVQRAIAKVVALHTVAKPV